MVGKVRVNLVAKHLCYVVNDFDQGGDLYAEPPNPDIYPMS